jgi:hypothetical protein
MALHAASAFVRVIASQMNVLTRAKRALMMGVCLDALQLNAPKVSPAVKANALILASN